MHLRRLLTLLATLLVCAALRAAPAPALVIGAEDDAAPWSYADGRGYVNELVRAAYARQGWPLRLDVLPYARCKQMALRGELAACFTTSLEPGLEGRLMFPGRPVIAPRHVLMVAAKSALVGCSAQDWAAARSVAVVNGYEYAEGIEALLKSGQLRPQKTTSELAGLRMVALGRVDAAAITLDEVKRLDYLLQRSGLSADGFRVLCDFGAVPGYVAFSARHPQGRAAMEAFELGLAELLKDGSVARLQQAWRLRALSAGGP
jgi:polar amino acid transport system substrate-binding protein